MSAIQTPVTSLQTHEKVDYPLSKRGLPGETIMFHMPAAYGGWSRTDDTLTLLPRSPGAYGTSLQRASSLTALRSPQAVDKRQDTATKTFDNANFTTALPQVPGYRHSPRCWPGPSPRAVEVHCPQQPMSQADAWLARRLLTKPDAVLSSLRVARLSARAFCADSPVSVIEYLIHLWRQGVAVLYRIMHGDIAPLTQLSAEQMSELSECQGAYCLLNRVEYPEARYKLEKDFVVKICQRFTGRAHLNVILIGPGGYFFELSFLNRLREAGYQSIHVTFISRDETPIVDSVNRRGFGRAPQQGYSPQFHARRVALIEQVGGWLGKRFERATMHVYGCTAHYLADVAAGLQPRCEVVGFFDPGNDGEEIAYGADTVIDVGQKAGDENTVCCLMAAQDHVFEFCDTVAELEKPESDSGGESQIEDAEVPLL